MRTQKINDIITIVQKVIIHQMSYYHGLQVLIAFGAFSSYKILHNLIPFLRLVSRQDNLIF